MICYGGYIKTVIQLVNPDMRTFEDFINMTNQNPQNLEVIGLTKSFMVMLDSKSKS